LASGGECCHPHRDEQSGQFYAELRRQYQYIFIVKNAKIRAMIKAAMLDAGMIILSRWASGWPCVARPPRPNGF
jgi:hypothetical protein